MKKNKFFICIAVLSVMFAISVNICSDSKNKAITDIILNSLEALADDESSSGEHITCYCALASDANCAVNNNGSSKCAGGTNIKCWEYNRNCN